MRHKALFQIVPEIYDAGLGRSQWPDVLDRLARLLDSSIAGLSIRTRDWRVSILNKAFIEKNQVIPELTFLVHNQTTLRDPIRITTGLPKVIYPSMDSKHFPASEVTQVLQGLLFEELVCSAHFAAALPLENGGFSPEHVKMLLALLPHLERSVRTQMRLADATVRNQYLSQALDTVRQGVVVVGSHDQILHANRMARATINSFTVKGVDREKSSYTGPKLPAPLAALPRQIAKSKKSMVLSSITLSDSGKDRSTTAVIVGCEPSGATNVLADQPKATIFLAAPDSSSVNWKILQILYQLTPTEASVVNVLANGVGVKQAARRLGVAPSTVRTHLHRAFGKLGVSRQAELASLVQTLPALCIVP